MNRITSRGWQLPCLLSAVACTGSHERSQEDEGINDEKLKLTRGWGKVFLHSDEVDHRKVTLHNRYGTTLTANPYQPKGVRDPLVAITVSGPFGTAKEQSSDLYTQTMVERGSLTLAFNPSYVEGSGGTSRCMTPLDISTEGLGVTVNHLSCHEDVDPERIDIIGICGWSDMVIDVAALDPRIGITMVSTMYDMSHIAARSYFDEQGSAATCDPARARFATQHIADYRSEPYARAGEVVDPLPGDVPVSIRDRHDYCETLRGYYLHSLSSNEGWSVVSIASFLNQLLLAYADEVRTPVLAVRGEKAHSHYMKGRAFAQLAGENEEPLIVPGASHADLYDGGGRDAIPFGRITKFLRASLA